MAFEVFLSYNRVDKPVVEQIAHALKARGIAVWFDDWELVPGRPWQELVESALKISTTAAVFVGADGRGPWQDREIRALLSKFVSNDAPVIPVLLPGAPTTPDLPLFLIQFTWVDLRGGLDEGGLQRLEWGIRGIKPPASSASGGEPTRTSHAEPVVPQMTKEETNRAIHNAILRRRKELLGK